MGLAFKQAQLLSAPQYPVLGRHKDWSRLNMHSLTPRPAAAGLQVGTGFHGRRAFPVVSCGGSVGLPYDMVVGIQEHFQLLLVRKELISRPQLT